MFTMFYCVGENQVSGCKIGRGDTIAAAIKDWSYCQDWCQILQEFDQYSPTVIGGQELDVGYTVPEPTFIPVPV